MFIVLNLFPRSRQFVELISRQIRHRSSRHRCSTLPHLPVLCLVVLDLFISTCTSIPYEAQWGLYGVLKLKMFFGLKMLFLDRVTIMESWLDDGR